MKTGAKHYAKYTTLGQFLTEQNGYIGIGWSRNHVEIKLTKLYLASVKLYLLYLCLCTKCHRLFVWILIFCWLFILLSHNVIAFKSVEISERNICINLFSGKWKFHVFDLNVIFVTYDYYSRSYDRAKNSLHICKSVYIVTW